LNGYRPINLIIPVLSHLLNLPPLSCSVLE
jgi:hypothetical protein